MKTSSELLEKIRILSKRLVDESCVDNIMNPFILKEIGNSYIELAKVVSKNDNLEIELSSDILKMLKNINYSDRNINKKSNIINFSFKNKFLSRN